MGEVIWQASGVCGISNSVHENRAQYLERTSKFDSAIFLFTSSEGSQLQQVFTAPLSTRVHYSKFWFWYFLDFVLSASKHKPASGTFKVSAK